MPARLDETLGLRTQLMVQLAAILPPPGSQSSASWPPAAVASGGVSPVELKEIVYQSVAYVGAGTSTGTSGSATPARGSSPC